CSIVLLFFVRYPWFFLHPPAPLPHLHSFPTRRSSDLLFVPPSVRSRIRRIELTGRRPCDKVLWVYILWRLRQFLRQGGAFHACEDRKSTRLNSSHVKISYAVFCLKKKKQEDVGVRWLE